MSSPASSTPKYLTIGELARRGNVATSLLRFYEKEGMLKPVGRTPAGYRLYAPDALRHLLFIRKAQRYGFSLNDIKLMRGAAHDAFSGQDIRDIAEQRFMDIERRVTEMLVLRHELEMFLDDITEQIGESAGPDIAKQYRELMEQVCGHAQHGKRRNALQKLTERLGCNLARTEWQQLLKDLRGVHLHIWRDDDDGYAILYTRKSARVRKALERIAESEARCDAHMTPEVAPSDEGIMFRARGPNAFLYAQLFLALENADA